MIIPAKNEALHIGEVVRGVLEHLAPKEVVVIDDQSTDETLKIAKGAGAIVLSHPISLGYSATLQTGYKYAKSKGYPYLIQLDGDGQHLPSSLNSIYNALLTEEADLVIGNRFLHEREYHTSFARQMGMRFFQSLVTYFTGLPLSDTTSGYQGMTQRVYSYYCQPQFPRDFPDADVLIRNTFEGIRIQEIPVEMEIPEGNISMHRGFWRPTYYVGKMCLSIFQVLCEHHSSPAKFKKAKAFKALRKLEYGQRLQNLQNTVPLESFLQEDSGKVCGTV